MLRNFGISLLLLSLLAVGIDGFRIRGRVRDGSPASTTETTTVSHDVHIAEGGMMIPPR